MAITFPRKAVITTASPFVAFGAMMRAFLATALASINKQPTLLTKWIFACCFLLCFPGLALAGTEERCTALGSGCMCGEPLNTNTHDGGNATWTTGEGALNFNPDDSPTASQCYPGRVPEFSCNGGLMQPVTAASEASVLPPGHSLSWVLKYTGGNPCGIGHPPINFPPNMTMCNRVYRRVDANWHVPQTGNDPANPEQQKIMGISGFEDGSTGGYGPGLQISVTVGGGIHTRFDGNMFNPPVDFQSLGTMQNDCMNNYCRFEQCFDYSAIGEGRARMRMTKIPPGNGAVSYVFKPIGQNLMPNGIHSSQVYGGYSWYGQITTSGNYTVYSTHYLVTRVVPEDRNFWPGAACEVEGGCSGAPPPPPPSSRPDTPTGLIAR